VYRIEQPYGVSLPEMIRMLIAHWQGKTKQWRRHGRNRGPIHSPQQQTLGDVVSGLFPATQHNHGLCSGGQGPIIHLEADLRTSVMWAEQNDRRWAFTLSNAGSRFFEDRCNLKRLYEIDWTAVQARDWRSCQEGKQAELLLEYSFSWHLVERIGVHSRAIYQQAANALPAGGHRPKVEIRPEWYY